MIRDPIHGRCGKRGAVVVAANRTNTNKMNEEAGIGIAGAGGGWPRDKYDTI